MNSEHGADRRKYNASRPLEEIRQNARDLRSQIGGWARRTKRKREGEVLQYLLSFVCGRLAEGAARPQTAKFYAEALRCLHHNLMGDTEQPWGYGGAMVVVRGMVPRWELAEVSPNVRALAADVDAARCTIAAKRAARERPPAPLPANVVSLFDWLKARTRAAEAE